MSRIRQICSLVLIASFIFMSGCTAFNSPNGKQADLAEAVAAESKGAYLVEVHPLVGPPKIFQGALTELASIQNAVSSSAAKRYRHMDIELLRKAPNSGKLIKMTSEYDTARRDVTPETDYTLHDGDRVIIRQKTSSVLEDATSKIFGKG